MIKDGNSKDLIEAEEIKKMWQEYTEELYKKGVEDRDNHDGVVTHLDSDIPQCEVGLRKHYKRIKLVAVMELQLSYLK